MSDERQKILTGIRNSAVIKNPVLFEAIGIAPVVAMAVSLKTAIMLSVVSIVELVIIESFACLCLKKLKSCFRVIIYAILGVLINIPFFMFFGHFAPNETANVSIFLPIVAVNSLVALHCERVAVRNNFKNTFIDAVSAGIGYVFIVFIVSIIREILGSGSIYGIELNLPVKFSGLLMPFGGFLLLGFLAAFMKNAIKKKHPEEKPEAAFNLSEISQSHFEKIKNFIEDDYNPNDDIDFEDDNNISAEKPDKQNEPLRLKAEKPPRDRKEKQPKKEKIKKEKTIKESKPKKAKQAKETDISSKISHSRKTSSKQQLTEKTVRANVKSDYVSEFDDLLSAIEPKDESKENKNNDDEGKGGDGQ